MDKALPGTGAPADTKLTLVTHFLARGAGPETSRGVAPVTPYLKSQDFEYETNRAECAGQVCRIVHP